MGNAPRNASTRGTPRVSGGLVAGVTLRTIRESIGHTQDQLAEALDVDSNTIKGWETGRRPLINARGHTLYGLRRRLSTLGAQPDLVNHLDTAMDVDLFVGQTLETDGDELHPLLGGWVSTRTWNDLLAWVFADSPPAFVEEHVDQPHRSLLPAAEKRRFFDAIRSSAERAHTDVTSSMLLRRQVYFMASWDPSPEGRDWLADMERTELRTLRLDGWTPEWPLLRSIAVARACQGDPTLLHDFLAHHMADDICEDANLSYWSYWVEETAGTATSDTFMVRDLGPWRGTVLLHHLNAGLAADLPYLSLSVHTVIALIQRRPSLLMDDTQLARQLGQKAEELLDCGVDVPAQTRRELENIRFAVNMASGPARRTDA